MDRKYIDLGIFKNPLLEYLKWIFCKLNYQHRYWGKHLRIGYMTVLHNVKFGYYNWTTQNVYIVNSELGDFSYVSLGSVISEAKIGKFCSIGPNVRIAPGKHPTSTIVSTHPAIFSNPGYCLRNFADKDYHAPFRNVTIGNDVWICANAVIGDGLNIGDGAIIAANSVVTKDVEPYTIVGGVPARVIRKRFNDEQVKFLLEYKWWDHDFEWISKNAHLLRDIELFMLNFKK